MRRLAVAVVALMSTATTANAASVNYSISGSLGGDLVTGSGVAIYGAADPSVAGFWVGSVVTGLTFSISGNDPNYAGYVGTYSLLRVSEDASNLWGINNNPSSAWPAWSPRFGVIYPVVDLSGNGSIFANNGTANYTIQLGEGKGFGGEANPTSYSATVSVSPVPLPAALPMFGAALVGLGGLARRRMKKAA